MNELIINGKRVDLGENTNIGLTFSANNIGQLPVLNPSKTAISTLNKEIQNLPVVKKNKNTGEKTTSYPYKNFAGVTSPDIYEQLANGTSTASAGNLRKAIVETMSKAKYSDLGFPRWEDVADAEPLPGYIVFFDFPGDSLNRISHVGIVIKNNGDGTINVIEGNTSPDKTGDQRNGGEVCLKRRAYTAKNGSKIKKSLPVYIVGFGKPVFKS